MGTYEFMKQFVVVVAFATIMAAALATIVEKIVTFITWLVKKVRQHREKRLARHTEEA